MKKLNKTDLLSLKAKIKGLASEGRKCWDFIRTSETEAKYKHWNIKRSIGLECRYHLLAYGLLRGVSYDKIEPNSDKDKLTRLDYNYLAQICQRHCYPFDRKWWHPANIERVMRTGTMIHEIKVVS